MAVDYGDRAPWLVAHEPKQDEIIQVQLSSRLTVLPAESFAGKTVRREEERKKGKFKLESFQGKSAGGIPTEMREGIIR